MKKSVFPRKTKTVVCILSGIIFIPTGSAFAFSWEGLKMTPRVSVSEAFDDNVTFAKNNRKEDLVTNLSLGLDVAREDKTQNFTLSGEI